MDSFSYLRSLEQNINPFLTSFFLYVSSSYFYYIIFLVFEAFIVIFIYL